MNNHLSNHDIKHPLSQGPSGGVEFFQFEEDFVEDNVRCIPMIVRFKMDAVAIKVSLSVWSKCSVAERFELAHRPCVDNSESSAYRSYLLGLIRKYTDGEVTLLDIESNPAWNITDRVPEPVREKALEFDWQFPVHRWKALSSLQRFALLKLCRPGHENKNFPIAAREFGLAS